MERVWAAPAGIGNTLNLRIAVGGSGIVRTPIWHGGGMRNLLDRLRGDAFEELVTLLRTEVKDRWPA